MQVISLIRAHALLALARLAPTAVVNPIFTIKSPVELEAFAEQRPVLAKLAALFRHWGIDPIAGLKVIASFFASNPPPPGGDGPVAPSVPAEAPTRRDVQAVALAATIGAL